MSAWSMALALALLAPPAAESSGPVIEPPLLFDEGLGHRDDNDARPLEGQVVPGLIVPQVTATMTADRLAGAMEAVESSVTLSLSGTLHNPLSQAVGRVRIRLSLLPAEGERFAWRRLTAPPLEVSQQELDRPLPRPLATLDPDDPLVARALAGETTPISLTADLGLVVLDPQALPRFLLVVESYDLEKPSVKDVQLLLDQGGMADALALSIWAQEPSTKPEWTEEERLQVMDMVTGRLGRMRAPPALGDLQRLHSMLQVIRMISKPSDLERLLTLERTLSIMLTSAVLSYDEMVRDEATLELPIHGMHRLPSRSDFVQSYEVAMQGLRRHALSQLARLAFDPIDFRNAPPEIRRAPVQPRAASLLAPLHPSDVSAMLGAAEADATVEAELFNFYLDVRHEPAIDPLVRWLNAHPDLAGPLGKKAVATMGAAMAGPLLRQFVDPEEPAQRTLAHDLLLHLEPGLTHVVVEAMRSVGITLDDGQADIASVLAAFIAHETSQHEARSGELKRDVLSGEGDIFSLARRMRSAGRLARMDPSWLVENAAAIIALHTQAALELDADSPAESGQAILQLGTLPLGADQKPLAERAVAVIKAKLALRHGAVDDAITTLTEQDPEMAAPEVRELFEHALLRRFDEAIEQGAYSVATSLLELAHAKIPDFAELEAMDRRLFLARYGPALALGCLFGLTLLSTLGWLAWRSASHGWVELQSAKKIGQRLLRRRAYVEKKADEAGQRSPDSTAFPFGPMSEEIPPARRSSEVSSLDGSLDDSFGPPSSDPRNTQSSLDDFYVDESTDLRASG